MVASTGRSRSVIDGLLSTGTYAQPDAQGGAGITCVERELCRPAAAWPSPWAGTGLQECIVEMRFAGDAKSTEPKKTISTAASAVREARKPCRRRLDA
jgi:hypothetical protein